MFSVNPAYDFDASDGNLSVSRERMGLYQESARRGVGIMDIMREMKAFFAQN